MMRHTGKYYRLTVVNSIVLVIANVLVATWDQKRTSPLRFWIDLIPNGFSYGAILTTTLIVSFDRVCCLCPSDTSTPRLLSCLWDVKMWQSQQEVR